MIATIHDLTSGLSPLWLGTLASLIAGLGTGVGAIAVLFVHGATRKTQDVLLGTAAGVMLGATAFSLILPGIEAGAGQLGSDAGGAALIGVMMLVGAWAVLTAHRLVPHEHILKGREGPEGLHVRRMWLFVLAIAIHNFPEGLAVGVAAGGGDITSGAAITTAIFLQNLPEGFVVALA